MNPEGEIDPAAERDEMRHSVLNFFSMAQALIRISARSAPDAQSLSDYVLARLSAVAATQTLVFDTPRETPIGMERLVTGVLRGFVITDQLRLDGPDRALRREIVTPVGLILNEWAETARRTGALSDDGAETVSLRWSAEAGEVAVTWVQTGAAKAAVRAETEPSQARFGVELVDICVRQIRGTIDTVEAGSGWRLRFRP
jgi:two-component sensor histidine kinase